MTSTPPHEHDDEADDSFLKIMGVNPRDKAAWVRAAQLAGMKLKEWVITQLNKAAGHGHQDKPGHG